MNLHADEGVQIGGVGFLLSLYNKIFPVHARPLNIFSSHRLTQRYSQLLISKNVFYMYFQDISIAILIHLYDFNVRITVLMLHNTKQMQVYGGKFSLHI